MAVANHPLCEPVRFAHYKALVPIREVDGIVYVSGHGPEDINTYEPLYRGRVGTDLTLEDGYNAAAECAKTLLLPCSSGTAAWTASTTWCAPPRW